MSSARPALEEYSDRSGRSGYLFWCPGCEMPHGFRVAGAPGEPTWDFDGNLEVPTFSPSLLVTWSDPTGPRRCHLFLQAGQLRFLSDCTHSMAGRTVPLAPWPAPDPA